MFRIFRRALDAKMNLDATRAGVTLKNKKEEKVFWFLVWAILQGECMSKN